MKVLAAILLFATSVVWAQDYNQDYGSYPQPTKEPYNPYGDHYGKDEKCDYGKKPEPPKPSPASFPTLKCPDLSACKKVKLGKPVFENLGPSGSVCVYTRDYTSSCNLSFAGSFCWLQGIFFGVNDVIIDAQGNAVVKNC